MNFPNDTRNNTSFYYDLGDPGFDDVSFYRDAIRRLGARRVLELGCGTGRVLVPLAPDCEKIVGIDLSEDYVAACRRKIEASPSARGRAKAKVGDIARLHGLGERFDLVTAPWRVFQALATDEEAEGFFQTVKSSLSPQGRCILNVFRPFLEREEMLRTWVSPKEELEWDRELGDGSRVQLFDRRSRLQIAPLVIFPDLIWRRYRAAELVDEKILPIRMRCYYAEEFLKLIEDQGFTIHGKWGGYEGQPYGAGPELVVEFSL